MNNKFKMVFIIGAIISIGTPIIDVAYAINGINLPKNLMWIVTLIGCILISLAAIFAIGNVEPCHKE